MLPSLLCHELGHSVWSLLNTDEYGSIRKTSTGGIYTCESYTEWTEDQRAHSAITALCAGFFREVYEIMREKQSPAEVFNSFVERKDIPKDVRFGLCSRHASKEDIEAVARFDLEELQESANMGYLLGMILCENEDFLLKASASVAGDNHLLLSRQDAQNLMQGIVPPIRVGNADIWQQTGQVLPTSQAKQLSDLIAGAM